MITSLGRWPALAALSLAALLVMPLSGCGPLRARGDAGAPAGALPGSSTGSVSVGGVMRTYRLYVPEGLAGAVPLVVMLHGGFGSGKQAEKDYGWDAKADSAGFAVAYPDGLNHAWNVGDGCCGRPGQDGVDDVGFITTMVTAIEGRVDIDRARVYATGISNGGLMSYRLACDTTIFAAIGPDSATMLGACPHPAPISIIHIHGTADTRIRYSGGQGEGVAHIDGPAVPALIATWRRSDGCAPPTSSVSGPVTTSVANCPAGRQVELITIAGAGHQWPGAPDRPLRQKLAGTDAPSKALNATDTIWQFLARHRLPG